MQIKSLDTASQGEGGKCRTVTALDTSLVHILKGIRKYVDQAQVEEMEKMGLEES